MLFEKYIQKRVDREVAMIRQAEAHFVESTGGTFHPFFHVDIDRVYQILEFLGPAKYTGVELIPRPDGGVIKNYLSEGDRVLGKELRIYLEKPDWCKFEAQPFYQELMEYLDNLKIQKKQASLDDQQGSEVTE